MKIIFCQTNHQNDNEFCPPAHYMSVSCIFVKQLWTVRTCSDGFTISSFLAKYVNGNHSKIMD